MRAIRPAARARPPPRSTRPRDETGARRWCRTPMTWSPRRPPGRTGLPRGLGRGGGCGGRGPVPAGRGRDPAPPAGLAARGARLRHPRQVGARDGNLGAAGALDAGEHLDASRWRRAGRSTACRALRMARTPAARHPSDRPRNPRRRPSTELCPALLPGQSRGDGVSAHPAPLSFLQRVAP